MKAVKTVKPGDIVTYHGSIEAARPFTYYVSTIDARGRLTLLDHTYPSVRPLSQVRPASVRPTGKTVNLCACGHDADYLLHCESDVCGVCAWSCSNHRPEA